jgi:hypothetical protein
MIRKFIIIGFILMLVGAAALQWISFEKQKEQKKAHYRLSKQDGGINEYLQQYKHWLSLKEVSRHGYWIKTVKAKHLLN